MNILLDKDPVPQTDWSAAPIHVSLALGNACDFMCPCCFAPINTGRVEGDQGIAWPEESDKLGCLGFGFVGSEPILHKDLAEVCREIAARTDLSGNLTTRRHHWRRMLSDALSGRVHMIHVSLDATYGVYEANCGHSFGNLQGRIPDIRDTFRFDIKYLVNAASSAGLTQAAEFAFGEGALKRQLLPEVDQGGAQDLAEEILEQFKEWVADNRLTAVNILASGHRSEFGYDGMGRRVVIRELDQTTTNNAETLTITSNKTYLWDGAAIVQERDSTGSNVYRQFYQQGFVDTDGTVLFYTRDRLGSIRELTDGTQTVQARFEYDPNGVVSQVSGTRVSPFGYAGYFGHSPSKLSLTLYRAYDPNLGRWISRDPIGEFGGGNNLYEYVNNNGIIYTDPLGLCDPMAKLLCEEKVTLLYQSALTLMQMELLQDQIWYNKLTQAADYAFLLAGANCAISGASTINPIAFAGCMLRASVSYGFANATAGSWLDAQEKGVADQAQAASKAYEEGMASCKNCQCSSN